MGKIKFVLVLIVLIMTAMIVYGFSEGDFFGEGSIILGIPWGQVTMVDLYSCFVMFGLWVFYREKTIPGALGWFLSFLLLGAPAIALYMLRNLIGARGDVGKIFMG